MKFNLIRFLALALILSACLRDDELSVTETSLDNFSEIKPGEQITFTFSHPLKDEKLMDMYSLDSYYSLTPELYASESWKDMRTLAITPSRNISPGTKYQIKFNESMLEFYDSLKTLDKQVFEFTTVEFGVKTGLNQWRTNRVSPGDVLYQEVNFNYDVDVAELKQKIHFIVDSKEIPFSCLSSYYQRKVNFELKFEDALKFAGKDLKIVIDEGVSVYGDEWESEKKYELETKLPMLEDLEVSKVGIIAESNNKGIKLFFNQELVPSSVSKDKIKIDPELDFDFTIEKFGIFIKGKFGEGKSYEVTLDKSIKSIYNKTLAEDYSEIVTFEKPEPSIDFISKNDIYLAKSTSKNIGLSIIGIDRIKVDVYKIYENNLTHFFNKGIYSDYHYVNGDYQYYTRYLSSQYGDKISSESFDVSEMPGQGNAKVYTFDPSHDISKTGVYVIEVYDPKDSYSTKKSQMVAFSDLGIITKKSKENLYVFVNSLRTATPLANAKVGVISRKNQKYYNAVTNSQGMAVIKGYSTAGKIDVDPQFIYVTYGNDVNYLALDYKNRHSTYTQDVYVNSNNDYRAFFYGDRNLYRPGDTVVLAGIIRDKKLNTLANVPIIAEINTPNGSEYKKLKINLNEEGGFSKSIYMPANVPTGTYTIGYRLNNEVWLGNYSIKIEEFMPEQLRIHLRTDKENYNVKDSIKLGADVETLYGSVAADMSYELNYELMQKPIRFKGFEAYEFDLEIEKDKSDDDDDYAQKATKLRNDQYTGKTDKEGKIEHIYTMHNILEDNGIVSCNALLTVFDENGRPVYKGKNIDIYTQNIYFGLGNTDYYNRTDEAIDVPLTAVTKEGKFAAQSLAQVTLVRNVWHSVIVRSDNGRYRYTSQKESIVLEEKEVTIYDKNTKFTFTPREYGSYEVRIKAPDSKNYVVQSFYCYNWGAWGRTSENVKIDKEGSITIETDKKEYLLEDKCKVLFKAPFDGKMLVSIERDNVFTTKILEVKNKTASMIIDMYEDYLPNVYISAVLYRPVDSQALPITVAMGVKSINVRKALNKINMEIEAPEKIRSKRTQKIKVKTDKKNQDVMLTLAVVDEGILQISNYITPDPFKYFYSPMNLGVETFSMYKRLYPDLRLASSKSGAGEGFYSRAAAFDMMENPIANKRVKLLAYWSGILKSDANGEVEVPVYIPQFAGEVRIMAQAYRGKAFGVAEKPMKVADPIVINASIPRFLYPEDQFDMTVTIRNTELKESDCKIDISVSKNLELSGDKKATVKLEKSGQAKVTFPITAKHALSEELITVRAKAHGETFEHETYINIQSPSSLIQTSKYGSLKSNDAVELDLLDDFIPETHSAKVIISKSPLLEYMEDMYKLLGYPHGCAEQTISKAFPQLYFADLLPVSNIPDNKKSIKAAANNVNAAITKLTTLQTWGGGIKYWSSSSDASKWVSVYALHFLAEAQKAGYNVEYDMLHDLIEYVEKNVTSYTPISYRTYYDGKSYYKTYFPKETVYAYYVLAQLDRFNNSALNRIKDEMDELSTESKYLLAGAYSESGDTKTAKEILNNIEKIKDEGAETGGTYGSYIRNIALSLMVLLETDASNEFIPTLAKDLVEQMRDRNYLSTNEMAYAVMSLGKMSRKTFSGAADGIITFTGGNAKLGDKNFVQVDLKAKNAKIKSTGTSDLYYFYEAKGLTKSGNIEEVDSKLEVRRKYYDRDGKEIPSEFKVGQLVIVELKVKLENSSTYAKNLAITDMLPAGLELVNDRLLEDSPSFEWMKQDEAEYIDMRDDKINIFTSLTPNSPNKTFYYQCRAVTRGTYKQGVLSAQAMYDGTFRSYVRGEKIVVK